jgi:hypothetical protein
VLPLPQRLTQRIRIERFHPDHLAARRRHALHVRRNPGQQSSSPDRHEHSLQPVHVSLPEDLDAAGSLARDDVRVVEGGDDGEAVDLGEAGALALGLVEVGAVEDYLGAEAVDVEVFDGRSVERHHDGARDAELAAGEGDALGVITCEGRQWRGSAHETSQRYRPGNTDRMGLPAEQAMTPRHLSSSVSCFIMLYAPRSLKLNTGVRSSRLK